MDYYHKQNLLHFWVDTSQNGRLAAILYFCYNASHMDLVRYGASSIW